MLQFEMNDSTLQEIKVIGVGGGGCASSAPNSEISTSESPK